MFNKPNVMFNNVVWVVKNHLAKSFIFISFAKKIITMTNINYELEDGIINKVVDAKEILSFIIDYCKKENLSYRTNAKINVKVDLLITKGGKQYAFVLCKSDKSMREKITALMEIGINAVALNPNYTHYSPYYADYYDAIDNYCAEDLEEENHSLEPFFGIHYFNNEINVLLSPDRSVKLRDFIKSFLNDNLIAENAIQATAVGVYFAKANCWRCGSPFNNYYICHLHLNSGDCFASVWEDLTFKPEIVSAIQKYVSHHPELKLKIGEIKTRWSGTMGKSYMSFGCPECDALSGNFYRHDDIFEIMNRKSDDNIIRVELESPVSMSLRFWKLK